MKKIKMKRIFAIVISLCLIVVTLAGCGNAREKGGNQSAMEKGKIEYPIETTETLTIWKPLDSSISTLYTSENELEFTKKLYEETGIKVEYIHPPVGQEVEKFNLMIASGELPDIIEMSLSTTTEGADGLLSGGYVMEFSEDFLKNYAPNYWETLCNNDGMKKMATSTSGKFYGFSPLRETDDMTVFIGPMVREDYLKKAGLEIPETIDDWHTMLTKFKEMGIENPLSLLGTRGVFNYGLFAGAYGTPLDFYTDNGVVKYGPMEKGFKDFVITMRKWYEEGLLDQNFVSTRQDELDRKVLNGETGATFGYVGSGMGKWLSAKDGDSQFKLIGVPYPSLKKGEVSPYGQKDLRFYEPKYWISGTCKNPELAARFLDYGYTEKGRMLYNFGIEGVSYEMKDGEPIFTDVVLNNPDGLTSTQALAIYAHSTSTGPYEMDKRFFFQQYAYKEQAEAIKAWAKTDAANHKAYGNLMLDEKEKPELGVIMTDINSHVYEYLAKYIMGKKDLSNYDTEFVERMKELNIDRAIELMQIGCDRFEKK